MKEEDKLFWIGLVSLICSLFFIPFVVYIFPAIWLGWEYSLPDFVLESVLWIQLFFHTSYARAFVLFFRAAIVLAVLSGAVAYWASHNLTKLQAILHKAEDEALLTATLKSEENRRESMRFFLKLVVIIGLVFLASDMVQWAISFSPTPSPP